MAREITTGTMLVKDKALLPEELQLEAEPCVPGWGLVKNFDGYRLDREIQKAGWHFFCLADEIKATVFGIDRQKMVRRAIRCIVAKSRSKQVNSLEVTRVASKRLLGVPYMSVGAHSRHIQENLFLSPTERARKPGETDLLLLKSKHGCPRASKDFDVAF